MNQGVSVSPSSTLEATGIGCRGRGERIEVSGFPGISYLVLFMPLWELEQGQGVNQREVRRDCYILGRWGKLPNPSERRSLKVFQDRDPRFCVQIRVGDQGSGLDYVPSVLDNTDLQEHPRVLKSPPQGSIGTTLHLEGSFRMELG